METTPQPVPGAGRQAASAAGNLLRWSGLAVLAAGVVFLLSLTVGPVLLPYKVLTVYSGSMEPTIPVGGVVIDVPIKASDVKVRDIITFTRPDRTTELITHRVIAIDNGSAGKSFITKGDANNIQDGWRVPAVGTGYLYKFNIPFLGFVLVWLQSPIGRLLFLVIPAAALGLLTLYELWRPGRQRTGG